MTELNAYDLLHCTRRLPTNVGKVLKAFPNKLFLAGGFIRAVIAGEEVSDIDLLATDLETANAAIEKLRLEEKKDNQVVVHRVHRTRNATTIHDYPKPVQVITRWLHADLADVLRSLDFTICAAGIYWDGERWKSGTAPSYYPDLAAKRLIYQRPFRHEDAGGSALRILKFVRRGYSIPLTDYAAVLARLTQGVVAEKLHGHTDEDHVAQVLRGLLVDVDPLIDPDHIIHTADKDDS